jgi:hypothetical protein
MNFFQGWRKKEAMAIMDPVLSVTRLSCRYSWYSFQIFLIHGTSDIYVKSS